MVFALFTSNKRKNVNVAVSKPEGLDLDELEGSFLEALEKKKTTLKSSKKNKWISRASFSLSEIRDKIFAKMACGKDTTCVEQHEEHLNNHNHIKHIKSLSMRKNSAVIAPVPIVLAPLLSSQKLQLFHITEQQQQQQQQEAQANFKKLEAIRKIQQVFRQRHYQHSSTSSTTSTCSMDSSSTFGEHEVQSEIEEDCDVEEQEAEDIIQTKSLRPTLFKRVRLVFQFVSMLQQKSHKRQAAVIAIQRQWRVCRQQKSVLWIAADICFPVHPSKKRPREKESEESEVVERKKYCLREEPVEQQQQEEKYVEEVVEMEVEDDDLDMVFYQTVYFRQQKERVQKEKLDSAACLIQSLWRRALASQHVQTLRAIAIFEKETQSVMPTIRTRMTCLRQRLYLMRTQKYDHLL
jgi:hypothetical protein